MIGASRHAKADATQARRGAGTPTDEAAADAHAYPARRRAARRTPVEDAAQPGAAEPGPSTARPVHPWRGAQGFVRVVPGTPFAAAAALVAQERRNPVSFAEEAPVTRTLAILGILLPAAGASLYAHHSFAAYYNESQSITLQGQVHELQFKSPHVLLMFNVQTPQGVALYTAEWANPRRLGGSMNKDTLRPGDVVVVTGAPGRTASDNKVHLKSIHRPADGWSWGGDQRGR